MPFWCTHVHPVTSLAQKQCQLVVEHTLSYTVSKFEVNPTDSSRDIDDFTPPVAVAVQTH